jgi:hypothetical protein
MKRRNNPLITIGILAGLGLFGLGLIPYGYWVEPYWLEVTRKKIAIRGLDPSMDGFTILQLSDIHVSTWMLNGYLDRVVDQANALHPDVIALTGDYVFRNVHQNVPELQKFLSGLQATQAKIAILGNHDHWMDPDIFQGLLMESGVVDLSNSTVEFSKNEGRLTIAGLGDPGENLDNLDEIVGRIPDGQPAILLVHEADFAEKYAAVEKFSLQLSGHTHGGQVRVPLFGAIFLPEYGRKYQAGMYRVGNMSVYVNRGIGAIPYRFRLNCRPEITLFSLHADPG